MAKPMPPEKPNNSLFTRFKSAYKSKAPYAFVGIGTLFLSGHTYLTLSAIAKASMTTVAASVYVGATSAAVTLGATYIATGASIAGIRFLSDKLNLPRKSLLSLSTLCAGSLAIGTTTGYFIGQTTYHKTLDQATEYLKTRSTPPADNFKSLGQKDNLSTRANDFFSHTQAFKTPTHSLIVPSKAPAMRARV